LLVPEGIQTPVKKTGSPADRIYSVISVVGFKDVCEGVTTNSGDRKRQFNDTALELSGVYCKATGS